MAVQTVCCASFQADRTGGSASCQGSPHREVPASDKIAAQDGIHFRGKAGITLPAASNIIQRDTTVALHQRKHRRAKRGCFAYNRRSTGRSIISARNCISQSLAVMPPSTRTTETGTPSAAMAVKKVMCLIGHRFQRRADKVGRTGVPGNAIDGAACIRRPVRRAKPGQGWHHVDAIIAGYRAGHAFGFRRAVNELQPIPQPLDNRS